MTDNSRFLGYSVQSEMKVLITAPSLDEKDNVSGIATLVRDIIEHGNSEYLHFTAGRKDEERLNLYWAMRQIFMPFRFAFALLKGQPAIVHINTAFTAKAIIRDAVMASTSQTFRVPVLLHIHGGEFLMNRFRSKIVSKIALLLLRASDEVIVLSNPEKTKILQLSPRSNVRVLPNAINTDAVSEKRPNRGERTIIYFGRLDKAKGLDDIVDVCESLDAGGIAFKFECYGNGPYKNTFTAAMGALLGKSFYYGGIASGAEKWSVLSNADIFLLPSAYEGLPLALLESMAAGCIPVVSSVGSIPLVIKEGYNGFLIQPGNIDQIFDKLKVLLSPTFRLDELAANARATIQKDFEVRRFVLDLEKIYSSFTEIR